MQQDCNAESLSGRLDCSIVDDNRLTAAAAAAAVAGCTDKSGVEAVEPSVQLSLEWLRTVSPKAASSFLMSVEGVHAVVLACLLLHSLLMGYQACRQHAMCCMWRLTAACDVHHEVYFSACTGVACTSATVPLVKKGCFPFMSGFAIRLKMSGRGLCACIHHGSCKKA